MSRNLLAAVVSGALALPMAVQVQADEAEVQPHSHPATYEHAHEMDDGMMAPLHAHQHDAHPHAELHGHSSTVYGTFRYGVTMTDNDAPGSNSAWDIGSNHGSRFGIKGSTSAGAGLTAGFKIERTLNDGLTPRHHNVFLSGGFGKVTLGQHSSPYYDATTWDGANHLGGLTDTGLRRPGVSYASALGGPFDFQVFLGDGSTDASTADAHDATTGAHTVTAATGGDGSDHIEVAGSFAAGPLSLSAGYRTEPDDSDRIGGTVKGTAANITLHVGYESATDLCGADCDQDRYGFNLSYLLGAGPGGGNVFVQYGDLDSDTDAADFDYWVFGYSYYASESVTINAGHSIKNTDSTDLTETTSIVVVKVDF